MKRRILSIAIAIGLALSMIPFFSVTADAASIPSLSDKSVYWVSNYVSGDCNLCSHAYMLKRMAILLKSPGYNTISNTTMRGIASFDSGDGYCNDVYNTYTFTNSGDLIEFQVKSGSLTGSSSDKTKKIKELLKTHPEGIVVWGPNAIQDGWPHAVLITGYNSGGKYFYCADSAYNFGMYNKGIMKFKDSSMRGIGYCTRYYYLNKTYLRKVNVKSLKKYSSSEVEIRWGDIYGQNRYQISKSTSSSKTNIVKTIKTTVTNPVRLEATQNKTYYYKVRGYNYFTYKDWAGKSHEKYIYGDWSDVWSFKLK